MKQPVYAERSFYVKLVSIILTFTLLITSASLISGCNSNQQTRIFKIGVLLGSSGLGDRSFNDSAYSGLLEAQQRFNIHFEAVDYIDEETSLDSARFLARNDYDLIICVGWDYSGNVETIAEEFPETNFAAIDFPATGDNIASISYREHEADFLMGVLAAMLTETKKVAVIGGMDFDSIRRIITGFEQGVAYQDNNVEVSSVIAGTFSDPEVGQEKAKELYDQGVDLIHNAASRTGLGIIEEAKEQGKLTTGTSGDQRDLAPGNVVGNRPKRVDTAVLLVIEDIVNGDFEAGSLSLGLKENGLQLGPFDESIVDQTMLDRLEDLKQDIIDGEIVVQAE